VILLGLTQISGSFPITNNEKGTIFARIPLNACQPASLVVRNTDAAAIVSIKVVKKNQGGKVSATDRGISLNPGESNDWNGSPPRNCDLIAISTVNNSLLDVDGNWALSEDV